MSEYKMDFDVEAAIPNGLVAWHPTGSRYICDPPVLDTDEDYVVLVDADEFEDVAKTGVWDIGGSMPCEPDEQIFAEGWLSYKQEGDRGTINLIVTANRQFYFAFVAATQEAKFRNLTDKAQRVALFRDWMYDEVQ